MTLRGFFVFAIAIFLSSNVFADSYFVAPVKGKGTAPALKDSFEELLASALQELEIQVAARAGNAKYVIQAKLIALGSHYVASVRKLRKGKIAYSGKMKASSAEELDTVATRLIRAAVKGKKPKDTMAVGDITDKEVDEVERRTKSRHFKYLALGPATFLNYDQELLSYYFAWGHVWDVTPNAAIRGTIETSVRFQDILESANSTKANALVAGLFGGMYYFSRGMHSPFVQAQFGFGGALTSGLEDVAGFALSGGAGMAFFRTSEKQLHLTIKYTGIMNDNGDGLPGHILVALGVLI